MSNLLVGAIKAAPKVAAFAGKGVVYLTPKVASAAKKAAPVVVKAAAQTAPKLAKAAVREAPNAARAMVDSAPVVAAAVVSSASVAKIQAQTAMQAAGVRVSAAGRFVAGKYQALPTAGKVACIAVPATLAAATVAHVVYHRSRPELESGETQEALEE